MADDNKPLKYMRYAIGEIVLVVIGILIALQINTWNEERKNNAKTLSFFEEVQKDLLRDIPNIEYAISSYKMKDSLAYLVINNKLTRDHYKNSDLRNELFNLITSCMSFQFNSTGYNNLKLNVNDISHIHKPVFDTITNLYEQTTKSLETQNSRIEEYVYDNLKDLSHNQEWFSSKESSWVSNDTVLDYFLHDPFYKNRVKEFKILLTDEYKTYKIEALIAFQLLDKITKSNLTLSNELKNYVVDSKTLKEFEGVYKHKDSIKTEVISINGEGLYYNGEKVLLTGEGKDKFGLQYTYGIISFNRNNEGIPISFYYSSDDNKTEWIKTE